MIRIKNVSKRFYHVTALDNVSLTIPRGEVVGLLGPNGAGKTTLFKLISGILHPDGGSITPIQGSWPRMGYKSDRLLFPNHLQVSKYLEIIAGVCNVPQADTERIIFESLSQVDLIEAAGKRIRNLSKGMRQRLGLAQALIGNPPFLLLDEPSNGLDPNGQAEILQQIKDLHAAGKTILISSHQLQEITEVCTQLVTLNNGKVHYQSSMVDALTINPQTIIEADDDLAPIRAGIEALAQGIEVKGNKVILRDEALPLRREILAFILESNFDVLHVYQHQITLAEIYSRVIS